MMLTLVNLFRSFAPVTSVGFGVSFGSPTRDFFFVVQKKLIVRAALRGTLSPMTFQVMKKKRRKKNRKKAEFEKILDYSASGTFYRAIRSPPLFYSFNVF